MEISEVEKRFEFHDLPLRSFAIDFDKSTLTLCVDAFDESTQDYIAYALKFVDIGNFKLDGDADVLDYSAEIYGMDATRQDSGRTAYRFELQCRAGFFHLLFEAADLEFRQVPA